MLMSPLAFASSTQKLLDPWQHLGILVGLSNGSLGRKWPRPSIGGYQDGVLLHHWAVMTQKPWAYFHP
ncbi:hypothetical protein VNO77_33256 [Canavalia gladiata]|uniref:Uncharacterized protein n=1 Tax=Canavalia gladiata TaxID=3824 RepID=A0AAN9KD03_CANGL